MTVNETTRLKRAQRILKKWAEAGSITAEMIQRVLDGHYNYYVVFTGSQDGFSEQQYAVIAGVERLDRARSLARQAFTDSEFKVIPEWEFDPNKYPEGQATQVGRWLAYE